MLKACKYCGRIVSRGHICASKPHRAKSTDLDRFRSSQAWQHKREEVRDRDKQLCQICIRNLFGTMQQYTYDNLSVHHAIPLTEDYDKRLDNDNLLTVCDYHHEMAEAGKIPRDIILQIIIDQGTPGGKALNT